MARDGGSAIVKGWGEGEWNTYDELQNAGRRRAIAMISRRLLEAHAPERRAIGEGVPYVLRAQANTTGGRESGRSGVRDTAASGRDQFGRRKAKGRDARVGTAQGVEVQRGGGGTR